MDLISALKSGKPFKHKEWLDFSGERCVSLAAPVKQILSDDWEVKEDEPKLKAWIGDITGVVILCCDNKDPRFWKRAPWLDEK